MTSEKQRHHPKARHDVHCFVYMYMYIYIYPLHSFAHKEYHKTLPGITKNLAPAPMRLLLLGWNISSDLGPDRGWTEGARLVLGSPTNSSYYESSPHSLRSAAASNRSGKLEQKIQNGAWELAYMCLKRRTVRTKWCFHI